MINLTDPAVSCGLALVVVVGAHDPGLGHIPGVGSVGVLRRALLEGQGRDVHRVQGRVGSGADTG